MHSNQRLLIEVSRKTFTSQVTTTAQPQHSNSAQAQLAQRSARGRGAIKVDTFHDELAALLLLSEVCCAFCPASGFGIALLGTP